MDDPRLVEIAYHEAGHAVVNIIANFKITDVTITADGKALGRCNALSIVDCIDQNDARETRRALRALLVSTAAGPVAQALYSRTPVNWDQGDYEIAHRIMTDYLRLRSLDRIEREARILLRQHWREVQAVAHALLRKRTLAGNEVEEIFAQNLGVAVGA